MRQRTVEEQTILDNIVACLEYKKLDQKDLCDFLEVSQQMFTNWKNKSSDSYLKRLPKCDKKPLPKEYIERLVAQDAMMLLTDECIEYIADLAVKQTEEDIAETTRIPELTAKRKEVEHSISNITKAIEKGAESDSLISRLTSLEQERKGVITQLVEEEQYVYRIDRYQIIKWLDLFKQGNLDDEGFQKRLIDMLINSVTVWDEPDGFRITTAYNLTSCKSNTFWVAKDSEISFSNEFGFKESQSTIGRKSEPYIVWGTVFVQTKRHSLP